jgi:hypothetical protein
MATQEEMSRYFWSASTNCPPVVPNMNSAIHENEAPGPRIDIFTSEDMENISLKF